MSLLGPILFLGWSTTDERARRVRLYDLFDHWLDGGRREFDLPSLRTNPSHDVDADQSHQPPWKQQGWVYWAFPLLLMAMPIARMMSGPRRWFDFVLLAAALLL